MTKARFKLLASVALLGVFLCTMISSPTAPAASRTVGPKTAAQRLGWGTPLPASDEFNYVGTPDRSRWNVYGDGGSEGGAGSNCWPGHDGNGRRCADANHVNGEYLRQTGEMNGDSAGSLRYRTSSTADGKCAPVFSRQEALPGTRTTQC